MKQSPAGLKHLAANAVIDSLSLTVRQMDDLINAETEVPERDVESSSDSDIDISKNTPNPHIMPETSNASIKSYVDDSAYVASAKTAMKVMDIRQYLHGVVSKDLGGVLMKHSITRAVNDNNVALIRVTIPSDIETLDFRSTDFWLSKSVVPSSNQDRTSSSTSQDTRWTVKLHGIEPPDEYDWFSWDRMGKIVSMNEACEIFSIIKMSQCGAGLKELMINARRANYWACPREQMPIFAEALMQMKRLSKLVLRGLADDYMMQLIAQAAPSLKYLDVSCSKFVTDKGVQHLFFPTVKENSALYLIPSWIMKNLGQMWPLVHTLEYLDFSWTNVTAMSRKMVNLIPGSYMFKRELAVSESEAFGHHVFVRKTPDLSTTIHQSSKNLLQSQLHSFAGKKGVSSFIKFIETHPWKKSHLSVYQYSSKIPNGNKSDELDDSVSVSVITPSKDEKRIHGLVTFWQGNLTELYSIYPINLNHLGLACPKLRILSGTVTHTWQNHGALLSTLTEADMFGEPDSVMSLINSCPSLKKVRVRIVKKVLNDEALIQALSMSMSNRYLEELWIAPGSYKGVLTGFENSGGTEQEKEIDKYATNSGTQQFHANTDDESQLDPRIEDLVQLTMTCLRRLFDCCKKLRRIGNLSWWNISDEELETISNELIESNSGVNLLWDNIIIPGGCQFQNGRLIQL